MQSEKAVSHPFTNPSHAVRNRRHGISAAGTRVAVRAARVLLRQRAAQRLCRRAMFVF